MLNFNLLRIFQLLILSSAVFGNTPRENVLELYKKCKNEFSSDFTTPFGFAGCLKFHIKGVQKEKKRNVFKPIASNLSTNLVYLTCYIANFYANSTQDCGKVTLCAQPSAVAYSKISCDNKLYVGCLMKLQTDCTLAMINESIKFVSDYVPPPENHVGQVLDVQFLIMAVEIDLHLSEVKLSSPGSKYQATVQCGSYYGQYGDFQIYSSFQMCDKCGKFNKCADEHSCIKTFPRSCNGSANSVTCVDTITKKELTTDLQLSDSEVGFYVILLLVLVVVLLLVVIVLAILLVVIVVVILLVLTCKKIISCDLFGTNADRDTNQDTNQDANQDADQTTRLHIDMSDNAHTPLLPRVEQPSGNSQSDDGNPTATVPIEDDGNRTATVSIENGGNRTATVPIENDGNRTSIPVQQIENTVLAENMTVRETSEFESNKAEMMSLSVKSEPISDNDNAFSAQDIVNSRETQSVTRVTDQNTSGT